MNDKFFIIFPNKKIAELTNYTEVGVCKWRTGKTKKSKRLNAFYNDNIALVEKIVKLKKEGAKRSEVNEILGIDITIYKWRLL